MEYLQNLTKGSGKGKVGAIIGITSPISFTKMGIKNATELILKEIEKII